MTLRNAFENLSTEEQQEILYALLEHIEQMRPPRALQYARDPQDRMHVLIGNNTPGTAMGLISGSMWGSAGSYPAWYGTGSPTSMDTREQHKEESHQTFQTQRNRWTIT